MDSTGKALLKLLFNEGEHICVQDDKFAYLSLPLNVVLNDEWIPLTLNNTNPSDGYRLAPTDNLTLVSMNPMKEDSNREDSSVSAFRTFLIELDVGDIKSQIATIDHIKMPFSAQIFSGGKSIHTAIILSEDIESETKYRFIANWIFNVVGSLVDRNCINPSRGIRVPGAYRENGKKQRLKTLKNRISHKELFDWLNKYEHLRPKVREKKLLTGKTNVDRLSGWVAVALAKGIDFKNGRNKTWFSIGVDFAKAGYTEDQTIDELQKYFEEEHDFKEKEWLTSIRSAFKYVDEGNK